jgi:hypothetical protein
MSTDRPAAKHKPAQGGKLNDWKTYAAYYIKRLDGPDGDNAYHSLIEADDAIIPFLIEAFRNQQNPAIRSTLVEIIWHHKLPETVEFLSEALNDSAAEVWKSALDGLVARQRFACSNLRGSRSGLIVRPSLFERNGMMRRFDR